MHNTNILVIACVVAATPTVCLLPLHRLFLLEHVFFNLRVLEQVLVDHDRRLFLLQMLLLEPCFLQDYLEFSWKFLDIERLRNRVPAVVLLSGEQIRSRQFVILEAVFPLFFFGDLSCFSIE